MLDQQFHGLYLGLPFAGTLALDGTHQRDTWQQCLGSPQPPIDDCEGYYDGEVRIMAESRLSAASVNIPGGTQTESSYSCWVQVPLGLELSRESYHYSAPGLAHPRQ